LVVRSILRSPITAVLKAPLRGVASGAPAWVSPGAAWEIDGPNDRAWIGGEEYESLSALIAGAYADFARASAGFAETTAGALTTFASGALRRTDKGLLIEPAATNLALQSQTLGTTWSASNVTVSADQAAAPDGTTTADLLYAASTGTNRSLSQSIVKAASPVQYTLQVMVKASTWTWFLLQSSEGANGVGKWFNIATGALGANRSFGAGYTLNASSIRALGSGFYLLTITVTTASGTSLVPLLTVTSADNSTTATASGTNGVFPWGVQIETGAVATSYIPTTTGSVTRAADLFTLFPPEATYDITYTFDDDSTQAANGTAITGAGYAIPTNLNRSYIKRLTALAA
jgi:hypothetical protein